MDIDLVVYVVCSNGVDPATPAGVTGHGSTRKKEKDEMSCHVMSCHVHNGRPLVLFQKRIESAS